MPPIFDWRCLEEGCKHEMTTVAPMSEYRTPPENGCEKCGSKNVERFIPTWEKHQTIKVFGGIAPFHDEEYTKTRSIR